MAQYATVTWQKGDEVTSQKLQQMASNEDWLKDNVILGNISYPQNNLGGVAMGRKNEMVRATRLEAINMVFDSQAPAPFLDLEVPLPPVFTEAPVGVVSIANDEGGHRFGCTWINDNTTDKWILRLWEQHSRSVRISGSLNIILIGR